MIKVYAREISEDGQKLLGEFSPEQLKHLIEVAKLSNLYTGEHTGEYIGCQFVTGNQESVGYFELLFEEAS